MQVRRDTRREISVACKSDGTAFGVQRVLAGCPQGRTDGGAGEVGAGEVGAY
jgi:hypothetical protein